MPHKKQTVQLNTSHNRHEGSPASEPTVLSNSKSKSYTARYKEKLIPMSQFARASNTSNDDGDDDEDEDTKMALNFAEEVAAGEDDENNHADKEDNVGNGNGEEEGDFEDNKQEED